MHLLFLVTTLLVTQFTDLSISAGYTPQLHTAEHSVDNNAHAIATK
jgi:hypothetical protein